MMLVLSTYGNEICPTLKVIWTDPAAELNINRHVHDAHCDLDRVRGSKHTTSGSSQLHNVRRPVRQIRA